MSKRLKRDRDYQAPVTSGTEVPHFQNFIDRVVSRNKADLNGPYRRRPHLLLFGDLANGSYRLGTINFNPETQQVIGDFEADQLPTMPSAALCSLPRGMSDLRRV